MRVTRQRILLFTAGLGLVAVLIILLPGPFISREDVSGNALTEERVARSDTLGELREGCIICHGEMTGLSSSHDPRALGCSSCHLGNRHTLDKEEAHRNMVRVPGNLDQAQRTCGQADCHPDLVEKVTGSLMASGRGMISVNRYVFGEAPTPDGEGHMDRLGATPADLHLHQLCRVCHLGTKKVEFSPITETTVGGGCTACHLSYSKEAERELAAYKKGGEVPRSHPRLDIEPDNTRCFACHARSGRISTSYRGLHETTLDPEDVSPGDDYLVHEDGRVFSRQPADVHHEKEMACIDCHTARDTMGDGKTYKHQNEQVEVSCVDCHRTGRPETVKADKLDTDSRKILKLRDREVPDREYVLTERRGQPLVNVFLDKMGKVVMEGKKRGNIHALKSPLPVCTQGVDGHERLTCKSCHTSWSPTCIACHTRRDDTVSLLRRILKGKDSYPWEELMDLFVAAPPTMGVRIDYETKKEIIDTFIPGMIMTIDDLELSYDYRNQPLSIGGNTWQVFRRLYAPTSSHTIVREARRCESCHLDSRAVGYGKGTLVYRSGESFPWSFTPSYGPHPVDRLPLDAWIEPGNDGKREYVSTRRGARPLNRREQYKVLRVGRCLQCHPSEGSKINPIYSDFQWSLDNRKPVCGRD